MDHLMDLTPLQAEKKLEELNHKLSESEKDHPGTAWYLSQLARLANTDVVKDH